MWRYIIDEPKEGETITATHPGRQLSRAVSEIQEKAIIEITGAEVTGGTGTPTPVQITATDMGENVIQLSATVNIPDPPEAKDPPKVEDPNAQIFMVYQKLDASTYGFDWVRAHGES